MNITKEGDWIVLWLPESVTPEASKELNLRVKNYLKDGSIKFIADASQLTYICSIGIGTLVNLLKESNKLDGKIIIRNLHGEAYDLFCETHLDTLFEMANSESIIVKKSTEKDENTSDSFTYDYSEETDIGIYKVSGSLIFPVGFNKIKLLILEKMQERQKFIIDCEKLTFIDSMSIGELLDLNQLIKSTGAILVFSNITGLVKELFDELLLSRIINITDNISQALTLIKKIKNE